MSRDDITILVEVRKSLDIHLKDVPVILSDVSKFNLFPEANIVLPSAEATILIDSTLAFPRPTIERPMTLIINTIGRKTTRGAIVRPFGVGISTAGSVSTPPISLDVYTGGGYGSDIYGDAPPNPASDLYGEDLYTNDVYGDATSPGVTYYGVVAQPITVSMVSAGINPLKQTPVAEISLASHATPSVRTNHTIKIRARTTSGSGGYIKAALYEGATNRSGDITSAVLTNALADYTLVIPDASAAAITSYSNLSIKIWGYHPAGSALVFEVANLYLQLPA